MSRHFLFHKTIASDFARWLDRPRLHRPHRLSNLLCLPGCCSHHGVDLPTEQPAERSTRNCSSGTRRTMPSMVNLSSRIAYCYTQNIAASGSCNTSIHSDSGGVHPHCPDHHRRPAHITTASWPWANAGTDAKPSKAALAMIAC